MDIRITYTEGQLRAFLLESNLIEGINRVLPEEANQANIILQSDHLSVSSIEKFVTIVSTGQLRDRVGMNVMVGSHIPPSGGPVVRSLLSDLIHEINTNIDIDPYDSHKLYEDLHPFTDGNGRSGRLIWAWIMIRHVGPGITRKFLHEWYYQSLER